MVVFDGRQLVRERRRDGPALPPPPRRCRPATAWSSRRGGCSGSRSPIMSSSTQRLQAAERVRLARRVARSGGCRRCCPLPRHSSITRFLAVEEQQLDRELVLACFEDAAQLEQGSGGRGAVVGADEAEVRERAWCRSGWRGRCVRAGVPGIVAMTFAIDISPSGVLRDEHLLAALDAGRFQLLEDVAPRLDERRRAGGRGPNATCFCRCSQARLLSNDGASGARLRRCDGAWVRRCGDLAVDCSAMSAPESISAGRPVTRQRDYGADDQQRRAPSHRRSRRTFAPFSSASPAARSPAACAPM